MQLQKYTVHGKYYLRRKLSYRCVVTDLQHPLTPIHKLDPHRYFMCSHFCLYICVRGNQSADGRKIMLVVSQGQMWRKVINANSLSLSPFSASFPIFCFVSGFFFSPFSKRASLGSLVPGFSYVSFHACLAVLGSIAGLERQQNSREQSGSDSESETLHCNN